MNAKLLILTILVLAAGVFASMDYYVGDQHLVSTDISSAVAGLDLTPTVNTAGISTIGVTDNPLSPADIARLAGAFNTGPVINNGGITVIPQDVLDALKRLPKFPHDFPGDGDNGTFCVLNIEVTPSDAYVLPGAYVKFHSTTPDVEWSAKYGRVVKRGSYAYYQAPTNLLGNSELVDEVSASKIKCSGKAEVHIMADRPASMDLDAPVSLNINENADVYALVMDKYGNPVSGKNVKFSLSAESGVPAASLTAGSDDGLVVNVVTNDEGKAVVVFNAGDEVADYKLTAQYDKFRGIALISVVNNSNNNNSNNNNTNSTNQTNTTVNNGGGSGENTGHLGTGSGTATVTRAEQNTSAVLPAPAPEVKPEVAAPASDTAKATEVHVTYYKSVVLGGDITLVLKDADGKLLAGKKVTITSPDGTAVELVSDENGVIKYTPTKEGEYKVKVEGTDTELTITVGAKAAAGAGANDAKPSEATFDIVAALTGGNASSFSVIAVLVVVLILVVGAAVYFFTKKDEM